MKSIRFNILAFLIGAGALCSCNNDNVDKHNFDNKLFIDVQNPVEEFVFKGGIAPETVSRDLVVSTALQAENEIRGKFVASPQLTANYNMIYNANAEALPKEMCVIETPKVVVDRGAIKSQPIMIKFVQLENLDRELVYVMPIELTEVTGIDALTSKTVTYFIFKGASLINVVANISENNLPVKWSPESSDIVSHMEAITVEALVNVKDFGTLEGKKGEAMSTLFGIEGNLLLRFGDSGFPQNQLQLVNPNKNFPEGNSQLGLPTNEWVHIAAVWDATTGDRIIYYNGKEVAKDTNASGSVDLTDGKCYIGKAWNDERWLEGGVSELRIWSVQRTQEEIANSIYEVDPASEGLVAYWKFNEGTGKTVKDQTGHGNDVNAAKDLTWTKVSLPEKGNK